MANISIKNVPEPVLAQLRQRARRNHRSLQGELMAMICAAVEAPEPATRLASDRQEGQRTIEQIVAEQDRRWKEPFPQSPRAVDMIRDDRDSRLGEAARRHLAGNAP